MLLHLPKYVDDKNFQMVNDALMGHLSLHVPEQLERILDTYDFDIDPEFLGFVDTYKNLSQVISLDKTVIDFGCGYAPQAFYFRQHERYIGVDVGPHRMPENPDESQELPLGGIDDRFRFDNTEHVVSTIQNWIAEHAKELNLKKTFAICNYVPDWEAQRLVRETFPYCYVYYP